MAASKRADLGAGRTCAAVQRGRRQPGSGTWTTCAKFGLPVLVALNRFSGDTDAEYERGSRQHCPAWRWCYVRTGREGGAGAEALARMPS